MFDAFAKPRIKASPLPAIIPVANAELEPNRPAAKYGLLITNTPFGFIALLGGMSLIGMMIKNAVVLLDEVNLNLDRGLNQYKAVRQAAISRLSPVVNAAATTVFGVVPLLSDLFWEGLAVTIMFGLAFGTILTMVVVPMLYTILFRVKPE